MEDEEKGKMKECSSLRKKKGNEKAVEEEEKEKGSRRRAMHERTVTVE